jgi:hypothetical protein
MASHDTHIRTQAIITRLFTLLEPFAEAPLPAMWNANGKFVAKWEGKGDLTKRRKRGPGLLELIYRDLPRSRFQRFINPTDKTPTPEPTEEEFAAFERQFLVIARRVIHREISKRLKNLPRRKKQPRGRPARNKEFARAILKTLKNHEDKDGKGKIAAVNETAKDYNCSPDTIWRYLRCLKRQVKPQSAKRSAR